MNNTSASKSRSLTMTLLMVMMALSPLASVEASHDDNWFGDYDLYLDGTMYEQEEVPWPSDVDLLSCTQNSDDRYQCDVDVDGDGNYDYTEWMDDCDDSTGTWACVYRWVDPLMDEGNYSLEYEVSDLEPDTNYTVYINIHVEDLNHGLNHYMYYSQALDSDSNGEISLDPDETYWNVMNSTCSMNSNFRIVWTSNMTQVLQNIDYAQGWCEGDFHVTTTLDGDEHEMTHHYAANILDCEMFGANWFCSEDWDNDGAPNRFMRQFQLDRCDEDANGDWHCISHSDYPLVWPGDHTVEWVASDLPDSSWRMMTQINFDNSPWEGNETFFNGTSVTVDSDAWTDEFTCNLNTEYQLIEGEWDASGTWVEFGVFEQEQFPWLGPCEQGDPLIFLWMDGEEYERIPQYTDYDDCIPDGFNHECWNADWDNDGDGEPDWTNTFLHDCEDMGGYWTCIQFWQNPLVWPGDHDFDLVIEDIDEDWSYVLTGQIHTWSQGTGSESETFDIYFNGTSTGNHTESWEDFEIIDSMCSLDINAYVRSGTWSGSGHFFHNHTYSESENFQYQAPCETPELFSLTYDGVDYEVEYEEEEYDNCEADGFNFQCWNDDWDNDGDGEPDWTSHMDDCEEDANGDWYCTESWGSEPEIEEGNHTMELTVEVEENESYGLMVQVNKCQNNGGCDSYDENFQFNATSDTETVTFYVETDNYTCDLDLNIQRHTIEYDSNGNSWNSNHIWEYFRFDAPCESPPSPFTLTADGVDWEPIMNYEYYDHCDEAGDDEWYEYDCWNDDWDNDGDGEPDWTNSEEECEDLGTEWECEWYEQDPHIDAGNHTMEISVDGLEPGDVYSINVNFDICRSGAGCDYNSESFDFNATSDTETVTFYVETDNSTCDVYFNLNLMKMDGNGNLNHIINDWFRYEGPCEAPPSPFTLTYDGIEWEEIWNYETYDNCEEMDGGFECYDYDDNDGEWHNDCEDMGTHWECQTWYMSPEIEAGNHTMVLSIENLMVGTNYSVEWSYDICQNMLGCDGDWDEFEFNATAETMSETFHIETDNYTCHLGIRVTLYEDGSSKNYLGSGNFDWQGPCEQPPSPFNLTYDGVEHYQERESLEFDNCEQDGPGEMICWQDMWDFDGDGDHDHSQWANDCEDMGTHWECQSQWMITPEIEEGNHTMVLSVEDLVVGTNYTLSYDWYKTTTQNYDWGDGWLDFNATAETMSETFYIETNQSTCNLHIAVNLYEMPNHDRIASHHYDFSGPCENYQMDDGLVLEYDDGSGAVEWEMAENTHGYDYCWASGPNYDLCMNDGDNWLSYQDDCDEAADGSFLCYTMEPPVIEEAVDMDMTWTAEELVVGDNYTILWIHCTSEMMMGYTCSDEDGFPEHVNFTATSSDHSFDWELSIANSTCDAGIDVHLLGWEDQEPNMDDGDPHSHRDSAMSFIGPCQWEWPVEITLEVDDNGWQEVPGIDIMSLLMDGEDPESDDDDDDDGDDMMMQLIMETNYYLPEGNWSMQWTMDGLEENESYVVEWAIEGPESGQMFICGNGEEIPFEYVNDDYEDCEDGADEQQYDDNGDPINWFDCDDGSEIWVYQVNDGNEDCPDGEDEENFSDDSTQEMFYANSTTQTLAWDLEVQSDMCVMAIMANVLDEDYNQMGMFYGFIVGELWADDDGDNWPDCLPEEGDEDDYDDEGFDMEDFAIGQDYLAELVEVDATNGTAMVFITQHTTLDSEIRMKIDYDFFDGDGVLNETEAASYAAQYAAWFTGDECIDSEDVPPFTMNGIDAWCGIAHMWFEDLANNTNGDDPVWIVGWDLHYNVTTDADGEMTFYYPGDDPTEDPLEFNGTLCGGAEEGAGLVPVSWSYNGTTVTSLCVDVMAGDMLGSIEIVFGYPDTDGDGYNDFDDRFPDDPEEWADSDDDGMGDNADEFPNDPSETNDADGDGVGDNSDAFPWDASESADSDGDGWGDNSDAFPNDATEWVDTDGDGVGDNADTDADGDGTDDTDEDSDGDGVNDDQDDFPFDANETTDTDGDGVGDNADDFPSDANETTDTDGDGVGDNEDDDADGDGTPNDIDDFPLNSGESTDSDGDGVGDSEDAFPNNPNEYIDTDGDGTGDNADTDDDNDGTLDNADAFPLDPTESSDTDGDGYGDNSDAFPNDAGEWSDYDGDGVGDNSDAFMSDPYESRDSDGDGTGDNADWAPNDPNEKVDSDGDGVGNNADDFPTDPSETKDTDGDGIGDNADDDADGDGIPDDSVDPVDEEDSGGILPGFTAITGLASVLGAAILVAGRRKD